MNFTGNCSQLFGVQIGLEYGIEVRQSLCFKLETWVYPELNNCKISKLYNCTKYCAKIILIILGISASYLPNYLRILQKLTRL